MLENSLTSAHTITSCILRGSYTYNAFEQRVQKVAGGVTTQFVFDRFGHLLEEANASGTIQKEYIWLDDLPVAMVDATTNTIYFIHTDQLGTPQKITDGSANVVWDGVYDPFGNVTAITGAGANWGAANWGSFLWEPTPSSFNPLRFPGQYADAETALNQNWNRDYDPSIGRYIQSDPYGISSGVNTYEYVEGNPLNSTDNTGLIDNCVLKGNCPTYHPLSPDQEQAVQDTRIEAIYGPRAAAGVCLATAAGAVIVPAIIGEGSVSITVLRLINALSGEPEEGPEYGPPPAPPPISRPLNPPK